MSTTQPPDWIVAALSAAADQHDMEITVRQVRLLAAAVAAGTPVVQDAHLTDRQSEVLGMLAGGMTTRQIADRLDIGIHTVNYHLSMTYRAIGVTSREAAKVWAARAGLTAQNRPGADRKDAAA